MGDKPEWRGEYGKSEQGNFEVENTIGVPHPFCITHHHVVIASDRFGGMLGADAIKEAYRQGHGCGMKHCQLSFEEHETALLVACRAPLKDDEGRVNPELHAWLLSIKDKATENRYAGFAFIDRR